MRNKDNKPTLTVETKPHKGSLEGVIVTKRSLDEYEKLLAFDRAELKEKTVLNYGAGGSNLHEELTNSDTAPKTLIDVDLLLEPLLDTKCDDDTHYSIVADGSALPFPNDTFDIAFALWSTYQSPPSKRRLVFSELIRTATDVRIAPILEDDEDLLQKIISEDFPDREIVFEPLKPQLYMAGKNAGEYPNMKYIVDLHTNGKRAIIKKKNHDI